jgi:hypothetical protein
MFEIISKVHSIESYAIKLSEGRLESGKMRLTAWTHSPLLFICLCFSDDISKLTTNLHFGRKDWKAEIKVKCPRA